MTSLERMNGRQTTSDLRPLRCHVLLAMLECCKTYTYPTTQRNTDEMNKTVNIRPISAGCNKPCYPSQKDFEVVAGGNFEHALR